jgi:hypothetical protein
MITQIKLHGVLFSLLAFVVTLFVGISGRVDFPHILPIVALLIFFLGVPHGALDPVFASRILSLRNWKEWSLFVCAYLVFALAVVCIWWLSPRVFIASFFVFSTMHFSRDLSLQTPKVIGLVYGGSVIVLPALYHSADLHLLLSALVGPNIAGQITWLLHILALPWLLVALLMVCSELFKKRLQLEMLALTLLAVVVSPLIAFAVYFCVMHSMRHFLRTLNYARMPISTLFRISLAPMIGVVFIGLLGWLCLPTLPNDERLLRFLFVGLAALTVPHMVLVDRVNYRV